jgi:hypothetical protein
MLANVGSGKSAVGLTRVRNPESDLTQIWTLDQDQRPKSDLWVKNVLEMCLRGRKWRPDTIFGCFLRKWHFSLTYTTKREKHEKKGQKRPTKPENDTGRPGVPKRPTDPGCTGDRKNTNFSKKTPFSENPVFCDRLGESVTFSPREDKKKGLKKNTIRPLGEIGHFDYTKKSTSEKEPRTARGHLTFGSRIKWSIGADPESHFSPYKKSNFRPPFQNPGISCFLR